MSTKQPEALRIAEKLQLNATCCEITSCADELAAADELRRLYEVNMELLEALDKLLGGPDDPNSGWRGAGTTELFACEFCGAKHGDILKIEHGISCPIPQARAAKAKATGAQS